MFSSEAAERVLLKTCRECITQNRPGILQCLTALERSGITLDDASATSISRLLGQDDKCSSLVELSDDDILQIIRRNAFGPDFITMDRIERRWTEVNYDSITDLDEILPTRILGLYPLAAMINHSCIPNSVRVFVGETMIVHTCQSIAAGDEIVWSYIPLIEGYNRRQMLLLETHNFSCRCVRCRTESTMSSDFQSQLMELRFHNENDVAVVNQLEDCILQDTRLSNEMKRYIRISYLQSYVNYLNEMLMLKTISQQQLLAVSFQLHLSLFACHNASTEHFSVGFGLLFIVN
jgi:SET domain